MSSVFQQLHGSKQSLPLSHASSQERGIRRRLSSLSLNIKQFQPSDISSSPAALWAFRRSKSISSMGEYTGSSIRKWWEWGWDWILSRKPTFASDLEINEDETAALGSWRHVFYKVSCHIRRKLGGSDNIGLPQTFRYDSFNYSKNFDEGRHY